MTVVLLAFGAFLYLSLAGDLDASLDRSLRSRAGDVTAFVQREREGAGGARGGPLTEEGESFAQVLDTQGRVVDGTATLLDRPALRPAELDSARRSTLSVERSGPIDTDEHTRILARPFDVGDRRLVVVVGASLDDNEEALHNLLVQLLIGGPGALLLASLAGYGVAASALRPVEAMRRRAAEIGDAQLHQRLPVTTAQDEISRLGGTLNAMLGRLEAAFARERAFVSDASHELRTPLAILKAELELALQAGRTPDELRAALASAAEESDRVAQLAEDLLVIARSDRGRLPIRLTAIDAGHLLEGVRTRHERRAERQGRELEVSAAEGLELTADPLRIEQALGNIVDNALRHGAGVIRLSAQRSGDIVELRVSDEGEGFEPEFLERAFERFSRGDTARGRGGSGLGLAIVDAIAGAHGGRAEAANGAGGAEVWLELPVGAQKETPERREPAPH